MVRFCSDVLQSMCFSASEAHSCAHNPRDLSGDVRKHIARVGFGMVRWCFFSGKQGLFAGSVL